MAKFLCMSVCVTFFCLYNSVAKLSSAANNITDQCKPICNEDVVISILNRRNKTGRIYSQIKFEETSKTYPDKKNTLQFNIDHDSSCQTPQEEVQIKTQEPPWPFYELIPGLGYYKLHTNSKTWEVAKQACEEEGTHLAIINSHKEMALLQEFRRRLPRLHDNVNDYLIYLGFSDIQTEGVWITIFDEPLSKTGYSHWERGEPHNGTTENCGCIDARTGKLHDCQCLDVLPFLCERELYGTGNIVV